MDIKELSNELESQLNHNDPEQLLALLKVWSFKPNYSEKNSLLLFSQLNRPPISLGNKKYWESIGYSIKPGEKPITIWIPVKNEETQEKTYELRNRYDITQTTGTMPYMFQLKDAIKCMLQYLRVTVKTDETSPVFINDDYSHIKPLTINPSMSNEPLLDLAPYVVKKMINDPIARERYKTASAMLIYRTTGSDTQLKGLIFSGEVSKASIVTDRAAYRAIYDNYEKWFPGLEKIPVATTKEPKAEEPSITLD